MTHIKLAELSRIKRLIDDGKTDSEVAFYTGRSIDTIEKLRRLACQPALDVKGVL